MASARLVWDGDFKRILNDDDVRAAPASKVVAAAREALLLAGRGELVAPPRARIELGSVDYVFTAGRPRRRHQRFPRLPGRPAGR